MFSDPMLPANGEEKGLYRDQRIFDESDTGEISTRLLSLPLIDNLELFLSEVQPKPEEEPPALW